MTDRDAALLALRPRVDADLEAARTEMEAFLHRTLRPVLKLQNPVVLQLVAHDLAERVPGFSGVALDDQRDRLRARLRSDTRLQRVLLGVVLGALTRRELAFALENAPEVRRRTLALLAERVTSQAEAIASLVSRAVDGLDA